MLGEPSTELFLKQQPFASKDPRRQICQFAPRPFTMAEDPKANAVGEKRVERTERQEELGEPSAEPFPRSLPRDLLLWLKTPKATLLGCWGKKKKNRYSVPGSKSILSDMHSRSQTLARPAFSGQTECHQRFHSIHKAMNFFHLFTDQLWLMK